MNGMQNWWNSLAPRERNLISWGGGALLVALLYAYLWMPISQERQKLRDALPQMRADAARMKMEAAEVVQLKGTGKAAVSGLALPEELRKSLEESGLEAKGVQLASLDGGHVSLTAADLPFDAWTAWVGRLQAGHGVRLDSCSVRALSESGRVRIEAVFAARRG